MTYEQLTTLWQIAENARLGNTELSAHASGIRSIGYDVCVGIDSDQRRHLLIPFPPERTGIPAFKSSGLSIRMRTLIREEKEIVYLDLMCLSELLNETFSYLVLDVLQDMLPDEPKAVAICLTVLEHWREMFGPESTKLGREQVIGLLGELIALDKLTSLNAGALDHWGGPLGGVHDFRNGSRALEVKTSTRRYGRFFCVSGPQQLDAPPDGDLHLLAIKLLQTPSGVLSIPHLLERIRHNGVDPSQLNERLKEVGYSPGISDFADNSRFDLTEKLLYKVDDEFPRVVAASFRNESVPAGVVTITYDIDLSGSSPSPLGTAETETFFKDFVSGANV
jgi:hypothetical protein